MKNLILLLLLSLALLTPNMSTAAAPFRDPVFPWPFGYSIQNIDQELLQGSYVAFSHDAFWFVDIGPLNHDGLRKITVESSSLRHNRGFGWLLCDGQVLMGQLFVKVGRSFSVMLYQVPEGLNLRVAMSPSDFYDLQLKKKE